MPMAPEQVRKAIEGGVELPSSGEKRKLEASGSAPAYDVSEGQLDAFIAAFETAEPGRHPPAAVRRALLVESSHKCGACRSDSPLQFHHIVEFGTLKHHDPDHMMVVCGTCHAKINSGQIDRKAQLTYKTNLVDRHDARNLTTFPAGPGSPISWQELEAVVLGLSGLIEQEPTADSQYDFKASDLEEKNTVNLLSADYFEVMRESDEPHFARIEEFLQSPVTSVTTTAYHELVDELRRRIAADGRQRPFDEVLDELYAAGSVCADRRCAAGPRAGGRGLDTPSRDRGDYRRAAG